MMHIVMHVCRIGDDPPGQRDVFRFTVNTRSFRSCSDDRQQGVGGQCRCFVGVRVDDLRRHAFPRLLSVFNFIRQVVYGTGSNSVIFSVVNGAAVDNFIFFERR